MCVRPPLPRRAARTNRSDPRPRARPPPASRPAAPSCPRRVPWSPNLDRCPPSGIFVVDCAAHRGSQRGRPASRWPGPHPDRRRAGQVHRATSTATCRSTRRWRSATHRRIVEFQARREFEGFGALPNDLGRRPAQALRQFLAANPHVEGVWNWTQDGGPLRAGPMTLYLRDRVLAAVRPEHVRHGPAGVGPGRRAGAGDRRLGAADAVGRPGDAAAITEALARSREAITRACTSGRSPSSRSRRSASNRRR